MHTSRNARGFALVTVLLFVAVLSILTGLVALFAVNNAQHSRANVYINKTLATAQGARNFGAALLGSTISDQLGSEIDAEAKAGTLGTSGTWVFDPSSTNKSAPDPTTVNDNLANLAQNLQNQLAGGGCYGPYALSTGEKVQVRITFTGALPNCSSSGTTSVKIGYGRLLNGTRNSQQKYSLPFVMVASGSQGSAHRTLTLSGQYDFTVGNGSFARYALFTDSEQVINSNSGAGRYNYFTGSYLFDGPVHTNGNFAFFGTKYDASSPGTGQPWFGGEVSSAGYTDYGSRGAYFQPYPNTNTVFRSISDLNPPSYGNTAPTFTNGVDWKAQDLPLPNSSTDQKSAAQNGGLYINGEVSSVSLFAGDDAGNKLVKDSSTGKWQPQAGANAAEFQYINVCSSSTSCTLYREDKNDVLYKQSGSSWTQVNSAFNGVLYVDGNVASLSGPARTGSDASTAPPAVASFAQLDLVSSKDVRITSDLKYQDAVCNGVLHRGAGGTPVAPTCVNDPSAVSNVLGVYAAGDGKGNPKSICSFPSYTTGAGQPGSICFENTYGASIPDNTEIDATLMAANRVDLANWDNQQTLGTLSILGGVIAKYDGVYGEFDSSGAQVSGVLPRFTYDPRFENGLAPPHFPTVQLASLVSSASPIIYSQTEQTAY